MKIAVFLVILSATLSLESIADTAVPNLNVVNSAWASVTNIWQGTEPLQLPTKLIVDFSDRQNGVVSGLVCEYPKKGNLFDSIHERLQKELKIKPKMQKPGSFALWRDEVGKRTITLTLDESEEKIQVIIVSIAR